MEKSNHKSKIWLRTAMVFLFAVVVTVFSKMDVKAAISGVATGVHQTYGDDDTIRFSWNNGYSSTGADVNYVWEVSANKQFTQITKVDNNSSDTDDTAYGLAAGRTYYVRVGATEQKYVYMVDNTSKIPADTKWSATVEMVTAPNSKIEGFKQTNATTSSMKFEWKKVASANEYQISYKKYGSETWTNKYTTKTNYTIKGLKAATEYNVRISPVRKATTGFRAVGDSTNSYTTYPTVSGKVKGLENEGVKKGQASFSWDRMDNVDGYKVAITKYGDKKWKHTIKVTTESGAYSDDARVSTNNIKLGEFYRAKVCSYVKMSNGKLKCSAWSSDIVFGSSPKSVVAKKSGRNVKISWSKVNGATGYVVYVSTSYNKGYKKVATLKSNTRKYTLKKFNKKALKYGSDYYVRVEPIKKDGKKLYHTYFDYYGSYQDSVWLTKW